MTACCVAHRAAAARVETPILDDGVDQWTVIGGTGRFENAEGSGTASTHLDLNSGTIAYAGN